MAKQLLTGEEARKALKTGIDQLADTVKNHPWPQGPQRGAGQEVWLARHHQ